MFEIRLYKMYTFKNLNLKNILKLYSAKDEYLYLSKYGKVLDFTTGGQVMHP